MKKLVKLAGICLFAAAALRSVRGSEECIRCEFDSERMMREKWQIIGSFLVPGQTSFFIAEEPTASDKRVLVVEAKDASGFLIFRIDGLDLAKYPCMRWRWRVVRQVRPPAAGKVEPDDQVCVVYLADGNKLNQKCVGYRWEFNTPVGTKRMIIYNGVRKVEAFCLRNRETPAGEWVEEERNVLEDFKAAFGNAPSNRFVISIGGNSQHSQSDTRAEIDYIEFRSEPKKDK